MTNRVQRYSTGTPWEAISGYSRAVRVGDRILVSGTTASGPDGALPIPDAAGQTRAILEIIKSAVEALGGNLTDIVRTRIYVKDIAHWQEVARVHGEYFADIRPACALVEARLVDDALLVEIEAEAVVGNTGNDDAGISAGNVDAI